ncbi:hypothetical protein KY289_008991 [Solanum tuberosum]|nr:hypothetical protein KY289_008991 [Solanum tuberosum]
MTADFEPKDNLSCRLKNELVTPKVVPWGCCPQLTKSSVDVDFACLWLYKLCPLSLPDLSSVAFIVDEHLRNGEQVCFASSWYYMVLPGAKLGVYLPFLVLNKSLCCIIHISKL